MTQHTGRVDHARTTLANTDHDPAQGTVTVDHRRPERMRRQSARQGEPRPIGPARTHTADVQEPVSASRHHPQRLATQRAIHGTLIDRVGRGEPGCIGSVQGETKRGRHIRRSHPRRHRRRRLPQA